MDYAETAVLDVSSDSDSTVRGHVEVSLFGVVVEGEAFKEGTFEGREVGVPVTGDRELLDETDVVVKTTLEMAKSQ